jgi:hypothetical protein
MSVFSLTKGSEHALQLLTLTGGSDTLLLIQPPREVRAEISVQTAAEQKLEAELRLREQRHSMTLQAGDSANAQHLADWVEAVANGTLDTAQAIPQRQPVLLPCCRCEGVAIAYSYLAPAPAQHDLHGVKCRHRDCQSLEGATTAAAAADAWNDIQREELAEVAEPATAQDERECMSDHAPRPSEVPYPPSKHHVAIHNSYGPMSLEPHEGEPVEHLYGLHELRDYGARCIAWDRANRPAQTEQRPLIFISPMVVDELEGKRKPSPGGLTWSRKACAHWTYPLYAAPIAQTAPDGWQLVPMEPTQAMREAFHAATERYEDGYGESPDSQWHAMLRAAWATSPSA